MAFFDTLGKTLSEKDILKNTNLYWFRKTEVFLVLFVGL